ncbi:MAG: hypothetical protein H0X58_05525, partial [Acidimicrobiia bacterium]|nr:hypothetical protein [Acidimicrobiia bacterium]
MQDSRAQVDLLEQPVSVVGDGVEQAVPPSPPSKLRLLVAVVIALALALLLAAPVTGRIAELVSRDRAEVVTEAPSRS